MPYLSVLDSNFEKPLSYLKSAPSNFPCCKVLKKKQILKFGTKNVRFPYFGAGIWKWHCHIWNQHPWICLIAKCHEIMKMSKFWTKGAFSARILKNYCHIWNQYLWITANAKICQETKMPKFGTKNALFGCFWARIF